MLGGAQEDVARAERVLRDLASNMTHMGGPLAPGRPPS